VSDGSLFDEQSFSISVANVNDAPAFTSTPVTTGTQDVLYSYAVTTSDPDGDDLAITATKSPGWLTLADNRDGTATLVGTPLNDDVGVHAVTLNVSDGTLSDEQSFTITVSNVNEPPSFTSSPATAATEDSPYSYAITAADPDPGTTLTITAPTRPGWLTLTDSGSGTATLAGTPLNSHVGPNAVVLRVSDGSLFVDQSFTINVVNTNDAPVFTSTPVTAIAEDANYLYTIGTDDPDGDAVALTAPTRPSWLTFVDNQDGSASLSGTPRNGDVGIHPVIIVASDGTATTQQSFSVTVTNTNDAPVFASSPVTLAAEDETYQYVLQASDPDPGTTLSFTGQTVPPWLTFTDNGDGTALLTGTPLNDDVGDHSVLILVGDGSATTPQSFTITVVNTNDTPRFVSPPVTGALQGQTYAYTIQAEDDDAGDVLVLTAPQLPSWLSLQDNGDGTGTLSGTPTNAHVGQNSVQLRVTDALDAFDSQSFVITVRNTNDAPTAATDLYSVPEGGTLIATAGGVPPGVLDNDTDPDGDELSATLTSGASNGLLQFEVDGSFTYQHNGSETTADGFNYIANDGIFVSNTAAVQIEIIPVNDPPAITSAPVRSASQGEEYSYTAVAVDPDSPSLLDRRRQHERSAGLHEHASAHRYAGRIVRVRRVGRRSRWGRHTVHIDTRAGVGWTR
jgi:hypothetical protein